MTISFRRPPARRRTLLSAAFTTVLGAGVFFAGGLGLAPWTPAPTGHGAAQATQAGRAAAGTDPLSADITGLQSHLKQTPHDAVALGTLGLDYVQQAKATADPTYYPKAESVLQHSLALDRADNFTAMGGMAALEAGRHNFTQALNWAQQAVAVNPYNSSLYGTLADAYTQLGRYSEAADAVQRMVDLKPGTPSLARASYMAELRGDTDTARTDMRRALKDAGTQADQAFAHYYLGELAFNNGDPTTALAEANAGLRIAPAYTALLQSKAKAEAALGNTKAAIADYTQAVQRVPQPEYVLQLGELYQSLGRTKEADQQYQVFRAEQKLFTANGVTPDSDAALFEADHGDPQQALTIARQGLTSRPFLDTHDALAWALHVNGHDREALAESDQSLAQGTRNALFHYHHAMIQQSLGDNTSARTELTQALAINPHFNPLLSPRATAFLAP
ncbi:tetratricopeptide repeat protein [Streptomyces sp. H10-C2]|uniref:tetratricopeptide repeat protein n=1 Tax=unclassified Streptomyces TaxID=2593676 RepID=UPI0024BA314E|nr:MULTISPECIES: tetratricopeptide repeat protein [unclassified Streptomyces]MDJ0347428.1 tetratricopeptide repeat protein [Streptomyces sp. PH10-H1]MDJ0375662.1 tetratricopeptide repeat protein [Streptomyces sp. H10-C2]